MDCTGQKSCPYTVKTTLENFHSFCFTHKCCTQKIDLSNNPQAYTKLFHYGFAGRSCIRFLNVSACNITSFNNLIFYHLQKLEILDLSRNAIRQLPSGLFQYNERLKYLRLDGNSDILNIDSNAFTGLSAMKQLYLSDLHIGNIASYAFANLQLDSLEIASSNIESMKDRAFGNLEVSNLILNSSSIVSHSHEMFTTARNMSKLFAMKFRFC